MRAFRSIDFLLASFIQLPRASFLERFIKCFFPNIFSDGKKKIKPALKTKCLCDSNQKWSSRLIFRDTHVRISNEYINPTDQLTCRKLNVVLQKKIK